MSTVRSFEDLQVWQLAVSLATNIYKLTIDFPKDEKYGIIDQLKRAVISISANIAEGFGRFHYKDSVKFLYNARGSLLEVRSHLLVAERLGQIPKKSQDEYIQILKDIKNLEIKLNNFISAIMRKSEAK